MDVNMQWTGRERSWGRGGKVPAELSGRFLFSFWESTLGPRPKISEFAD